MKRKILILLTIILISCSACVFLFGCTNNSHTHTITEWSIIEEPTCHTGGKSQGVCDCGNIEYLFPPANGHSFGEWTTIKQASCETSGLEKRVCNCGHYEVRTINATGHSLGKWKTILTPECETAGTEKRSCDCGYYEFRTINAIGHSFGEWITVAISTCETTGAEKRSCDCGHYEWREIPKKEHSFNNEFSFNENYHWKDSICQHNIQNSFEEHSYNLLGKCSCGKKKDSEDVKVFAYVDNVLYETFYTNSKNGYKISPTPPTTNTTGNLNSENYFYGWFVDENLNTPLTENTIFTENSCIYGKMIDANSNNFSYEIEDGKLIITALENKTAPVVVIPAYINSYPVYAINESAFATNNFIKTILICNGVQILDSGCFANCTMLQEVILPESISAIGEDCFYNCYSLTSVNIPSKLKIINSETFYNCQNLTEITIPENIEQIGYRAFYGTYALKDIYYNATNCANLDSSSNAFYYVGKNILGTTVHIGKNVEYLPSYLFYNNSSSYSNITTINFESNSSLELIGSYAFAYTKISKITLPNNVTSIGTYAFSGCKLLQTITLSSSLITISNHAFASCTLLNKITIPSSVTLIERYAFSDCSMLSNVKFDKTSGWSCYSSSSSTSGTSLSSLNLANNSTAATYLTSTYYSYYWRRG